MIPQYNISAPNIVREEKASIIPEQEKQEARIQAGEEQFLAQLEQNANDRIKNTERTWGQLATLSTSIADMVQKKIDKHKEDREAQIKLDILTKGVGPELEAIFKGQKYKLFEDEIATQQFAYKLEEETGDTITANEFRKMAGWEKYMVAEQWALEKAKGYNQYVYEAYQTTKIDVVRDGQVVSLGYKDNLSAQEHAALDRKIKFEYAKQFAGLNDTMVATVVKPEIDKFDDKRRLEQEAERQKNFKNEVAASDSRMIAVGFVTANPEDGHQLAHDWAERYAAREGTTISAGRTAFKENLISLVSQNVITYPEAMSIVNHEIEARDGSKKDLTSWKEWAGLPSELVSAANLGSEAREESRLANIAADLQVVRSKKDWTNQEKMQMMTIYKDKYDGYVPTELSDALAGHLPDWQADDIVEKSLRYQSGVYDFEAKNFSTAKFNEHKDKILSTNAMIPGTEQYEEAAKYLKSYTDQGTQQTFGSTETASIEWLNLYGNLEEIFNRAYNNELIQNGQVVSTPAEAMKAGRRMVEEVLKNEALVIKLQNSDLTPSDDSYSKQIQTSMTQSANGEWRKKPISADNKSKEALLAWYKTPLKQSKDIPDFYKDLALRMGINPIDLANAQVGQLMGGDTEYKPEEQKHSNTVLNLIYKFPTRSRITRAIVIDEILKDGTKRGPEGPDIPDNAKKGPENNPSYLARINVKTSPFNKKALVRQDQ